MNVDTLRLFTEVAHSLSFASVAQERGINPSSVSRNIAQLETQLGLRLFQRTTRTMALTEAGDLYFRRIRSIIEELDDAGERARSMNAAPTGMLRMTASVAFGERVIVPLLPEFRATYPDIRLELAFTDANVDLVGAAIDLAIRLGPPLTSDVVASRLFATRYRVVASPHYLATALPITRPQDLADHNCTLFALPQYRSEWRFRSRNATDPSEGLSVAISGDTIVSSALSLRSVVLGGAGPALLADWLIEDDIAMGRLVDLLPDYQATATTFDTAAWMIYPTRTYLPQKVRVTIDFLRDKLSG